MNRRGAVSACLATPLVLASGQARSAIRARVGLSLPLTGVQSTVASELLTGYQLAWRDAADHGVEIEAAVVDDHSVVEKTAAAISDFGRDRSIIAASGIVGTPHAKAALPAARVSGLPVLGIRSGATELRDGGRLVYHLRASYESELSRMLRTLIAAHKSIAILASRDSFGEGAAKFTVAEAGRLGLSVTGVTMAERNGADVVDATKRALDSGLAATALLVLMITRPAIEAVRTARIASYMGAIFTMSFTAGSELATAGPNVFRGLGLVTAFPVPRASHDEVSAAFVRSAQAAGRPELEDSVTAAEGFWYGSVIARAVERSGGTGGREALVKAMDARPAVQLGDEALTFDSQRVGRRYLNVVHFDRGGRLRA